MKSSNYLIVNLDVFYRDILVVWGDERQTRDALLIYHDKQKVDKLLKGFKTWGKGRTVYDPNNNAFFVWLCEEPKTAQDVGFLVHELFHTTYAVIRNIGMILSNSSEEVYAYTIGYLTEKILDATSIFSCPSQ